MTTSMTTDQAQMRAVAESIKGMFDHPDISSAVAIEFTRAVETLYVQGADEFDLEPLPYAILGVYEYLEELEAMRVCGICFHFILFNDRDCGKSFDKTRHHYFVGMAEINE